MLNESLVGLVAQSFAVKTLRLLVGTSENPPI